MLFGMPLNALGTDRRHDPDRYIPRDHCHLSRTVTVEAQLLLNTLHWLVVPLLGPRILMSL